VVVLGIIVAGSLLVWTRARVRAGESGVSVRNGLGDRLIPWSQVLGVSFPPGKRWARLELPDDEYIPLVAIQSADKEAAVAAMRALRELVARYRPASREQTQIRTKPALCVRFCVCSPGEVAR